MSVNRPTTPLRRVSRGSISALSQSRGASSTPLSFLEGALGNLADETSILSSNLEDLASIHDALSTFNEGFAMFLYGLKVAAYCIEWSEAPQEDNFARAQEAQGSIANRIEAGGPSSYAPAALADQTYMTMDDDASFEARGPVTTPKKVLSSKPAATRPAGGASTTSRPAAKAPTPTISGSRSSSGTAATKTAAASSTAAAKPKITLAQKKKREKYADGVIETLPLEYRGADPTQRRLASGVVMALLAAGTSGARIADIVQPPDMPQAKVNKCLIALVAAKHVVKKSNNGIVYSLDPSRHPTLP
ncbi:hypothetical protein BDZ90DRAFT_231492 [Jaminaea rosea]|uniref:DASH complex subunit DAM1 n=1 Tax=Jaminaea rosea TaxID=1569628 RepID=A0A316UW02_9BASI|nr:hypothetical protein BDZ90DRAFT_231492 [Jaminaea rosea]PWN28501.1 hypothetical protein BDZ90DRAFT_231492 [Jaminaea rosea]